MKKRGLVVFFIWVGIIILCLIAAFAYRAYHDQTTGRDIPLKPLTSSDCPKPTLNQKSISESATITSIYDKGFSGTVNGKVVNYSWCKRPDISDKSGAAISEKDLKTGDKATVDSYNPAFVTKVHLTNR